MTGCLYTSKDKAKGELESKLKKQYISDDRLLDSLISDSCQGYHPDYHIGTFAMLNVSLHKANYNFKINILILGRQILLKNSILCQFHNF